MRSTRAESPQLNQIAHIPVPQSFSFGGLVGKLKASSSMLFTSSTLATRSNAFPLYLSHSFRGQVIDCTALQQALKITSIKAILSPSMCFLASIHGVLNIPSQASGVLNCVYSTQRPSFLQRNIFSLSLQEIPLKLVQRRLS